MPEEVDWEEYSKHCETALQRAHTKAKTLGDQCHDKFTKSYSPVDRAEAECAYWLVEMIDDLRRDMKIGPGYTRGALKGPDYWKTHTYLAWGRNDQYSVEIHRLKERVRALERELYLALHR